MSTRKQHFWTTGELRTLRELYPALGPRGIAEHLPGRSASSITTTASVNGIRFEGVRRRTRGVRWKPTAAIDAALRSIYQRAEGEQRHVGTLAAETGYPRWWLKRRAARLGLSRPARKPRNWCAEEIDILNRWHAHELTTIQRKLRAAGFERTATSIGVARKRHRLSPRAADRYSATELARLLGVDGKTVSSWCTKGWLEADKREGERTAAQGGAMWWIEHATLRGFIVENPHRIDLGKVSDPDWFIGLLAGAPADGRQHRRARQSGQRLALADVRRPVVAPDPLVVAA